MDRPSPSLRSRIGAASNVLVLTSPFGPHHTAACMDLLSRAASDDGAVVYVTSTDAPRDWIDAWRVHVGPDLPDRVAILIMGGAFRSTARDATTSFERDDITIETVPDPGNLTQFGTRLTTYFSEWDDPGVVLCLGSLITLLQYSELEPVYRFLHELTAQVDRAGAMAHYHTDPAAHDEQELGRLTTLFDAVLEYDRDRGWEVR